MSERFDRAVRVTLATEPNDDTKFFNHYTQALDIENLRVMFQVEKSVERKANKAKVTVYNLAERSRAIFESDPANLQLFAGYKDSGVDLVYRGDVFYSTSKKKGPDWMTIAECGTGINLAKYGRSRVSLKAGSDPVAMAKKLAQDAGLTLPTNLDNAKQFFGKIQSGMVLEGPTLEQIQKLAQVGGGTNKVFLNDDGINFVTEDGVTKAQAILISPATGMIGSPEFGKPEKKNKPPIITVRSLLAADIQPGGLVRVESRDAEGTYRVQKVVHVGDTHGPEWETQIEGKFYAS